MKKIHLAQPDPKQITINVDKINFFYMNRKAISCHLNNSSYDIVNHKSVIVLKEFYRILMKFLDNDNLSEKDGLWEYFDKNDFYATNVLNYIEADVWRRVPKSIVYNNGEDKVIKYPRFCDNDVYIIPSGFKDGIPTAQIRISMIDRWGFEEISCTITGREHEDVISVLKKKLLDYWEDDSLEPFNVEEELKKLKEKYGKRT